MDKVPPLFEFRWKGDLTWFGYCYDKSNKSYGYVFKKQEDGSWEIHGAAGAQVRYSIESAMDAIRDSI